MTTDLRDPPYLKGKWERGDHGYSNEHRVMSPAFFAWGPSFRSGYRVKCIHTVDVYSLMQHLLNMNCKSTDGNWNRIRSVLKNEDDEGVDCDCD